MNTDTFNRQVIDPNSASHNFGVGTARVAGEFDLNGVPSSIPGLGITASPVAEGSLKCDNTYTPM